MVAGLGNTALDQFTCFADVDDDGVAVLHPGGDRFGVNIDYGSHVTAPLPD